MREMILNADLLPQFPDRFPDLLAARTQLERVIKVKKRIFGLSCALVSFCARHKSLHARWVHAKRARGGISSLMVLASPSLTSTEIEQKMELKRGKLRAQLLILVTRKALERVTISVRSVSKLGLSEEHVSILKEFVQ